jgi:tetratricopeptide (TPR) repeat protein
MSVDITKNILPALTTLVLILANPNRAHPYPYPSVNLPSVNTKVAQNPFKLPQLEDAEMSEILRQQSFEYILKGMQSEEAGEEGDAQDYYKAAIETYNENGWAWLLLGRLQQEAQLVQHSYELFDAQNDNRGKATAIEVMRAIKGSR